MAQGATDTGRPVSGDESAQVRAQMGQTRAALAQRLTALKDWFFGTERPTGTGAKQVRSNKTGPKKAQAGKSGPKSGATKKSSPKRAATASSTARKGSKKTSTARRFGTKAQKVLGDVLTGAAAGAVAGAAKAATEALGGKQAQGTEGSSGSGGKR